MGQIHSLDLQDVGEVHSCVPEWRVFGTLPFLSCTHLLGKSEALIHEMSFRDMCLKAAPAGELARGKMEGSVSEKVRFWRQAMACIQESLSAIAGIPPGQTPRSRRE